CAWCSYTVRPVWASSRWPTSWPR
ncbi:MAG: hypothetical protein AVDCRST_MAG77-1125, partial [uncultured Chloroflexi bacterium]